MHRDIFQTKKWMDTVCVRTSAVGADTEEAVAEAEAEDAVVGPRADAVGDVRGDPKAAAAEGVDTVDTTQREAVEGTSTSRSTSSRIKAVHGAMDRAGDEAEEQAAVSMDAIE